jgi:uncharacterized membrane protein
MEVNGLPLHPLVVHAAVVFGPLAALLAVGYVALPGRRDGLRWPMLGLALVAGVSVLAAYLTGRYFLTQRPELAQLPGVSTHRARAKVTLVVTFVFTVVAIASAWLHTRTGAVRVLLATALGVSALATLVMVVLTGDAGARAVWGQ